MAVTINGTTGVTTNNSVYTDASGRTGIGTTSPTDLLTVEKANGGNYVATFQNTTTATPYGVWIKDPTSATNGYPLLTVGNSAGSSTYLRVDSGTGNVLINNGYGSAAVAYGCRAWVNFNGVGTVAIRASGNVTSITDNGTADFTVNFTTAMPDTNYALSQASGANSDPAGGGGWGVTINSQSTNLTTSCRVRTGVQNALYDPYSVHITFFR